MKITRPPHLTNRGCALRGQPGAMARLATRHRLLANPCNMRLPGRQWTREGSSSWRGIGWLRRDLDPWVMSLRNPVATFAARRAKIDESGLEPGRSNPLK